MLTLWGSIFVFIGTLLNVSSPAPSNLGFLGFMLGMLGGALFGTALEKQARRDN